MKKIWRKIITLTLCSLMLMSNVLMIKAESRYVLSRHQLLTDILDMSSITSGHVAFLTLDKHENGQVLSDPAWCIEPYVMTSVGSHYVTGANPGPARNIILNWTLNYQGHELWDTMLGYISVQVAIWAKMGNKDPLTLPTARGIDETTANKVRQLAHELYLSGDFVESKSELWVNNEKKLSNGGSFDLGRISVNGTVVIRDGSWYWRTPLLSVRRDVRGNDMVTKVDVSSINGAIVTSTKGTELPKEGNSYVLGNKSIYGTDFYILVPMMTDGYNGKEVSISTTLDDFMVEGWDGGESQNLATLGMKKNNNSFNLKMSWIKTESIKPSIYAGKVEFYKEGIGPVSSTKTNVDGFELHNIQTGKKKLNGGLFGMEWVPEGSTTEDKRLLPFFLTTNNQGLVSTGKVNIPQRALMDYQGSDVVIYRICEEKAPEGYVKNSSQWNDKTGEPCVLKAVRGVAGTDVTKEFNLETFSLDNTAKEFSININKKDNLNSNVSGVSFGLFTTEVIELNSGNIPVGSMVAYGKTDGSGNLTLGKNLPADQNYILKELKTVDGLKLDIASATVDGQIANVTDNGILIDLSVFSIDDNPTKTVTVNVVNNRIPRKPNYNLTVEKIDQNGNKVNGAEISVFAQGELIEKKTTNGINDLVFNLPEGLYTVEETKTPNGYITAPQTPVLLDSNKEITMVDNKFWNENITIEKRLSGSNTNETFSFKVEKYVNNNLVSSEDKILNFSNGNKTLNLTLPIDAMNVKYKITENTPTNPLISKDNTIYELTYELEVNSQGKLVYKTKKVEAIKNGIRSSYTGDLVFNNIFTPEAISNSLIIKKVLTDEVSNGQNHEVNFVVEDLNKHQNKTYQILSPVINNRTISAKLDIPEAGSYRYKVSEKNDHKPYMTYDDTFYTVSFKTKVDERGKIVLDGQIKVESSKDGIKNYNSFDEIELVFKNQYSSSGKLNLNFTKVINGKDDENRPFRLKLQDEKGQVSTIDITYPSYQASKEINLVKGTGYKLIITEDQNGSYNYHGYQKNNETKVLTWDVVDDGYGNLSVSNLKLDGKTFNPTNNITFTNNYISGTQTDIKIKKILVGGEKDNLDFTFNISGDLNQNLTINPSIRDTEISNSINLDRVGSYSFTIKENNFSHQNISKDNTIHKLTFKTKIVNNKIEIDSTTVKLDGQSFNLSNPIVFTNRKVEPIDNTIRIKKILNNEVSKNSQHDVKFLVKNINNGKSETFQIVHNVINNKIVSANLIFDTVGTQRFTVSEVNENKPYMTYDDTVYTIEFKTKLDESNRIVLDGNVSVDNGKGVKREYQSLENVELEFTNDYISQGDLTLNFVKKINGNKDETRPFGFKIVDQDGKEDTLIISYPSYKNTFTTKLVAGKSYRLTVSEKQNEEFNYDHYAPNSEVKVITWDVEDDGNGKLNAINLKVDGIVFDKNDAITFTNNYISDGEFTFDVKKNLIGGPTDNLDFSFDISGDTKETLTINPSIKDIATTKPIKLTEVKTYNFVIKENNFNYANIDKDTTVYTLSFETEISNNKIQIKNNSVKLNGSQFDLQNPIIFTNNKIQPVDINLEVKKTISGDYNNNSSLFLGKKPEEVDFQANVTIKDDKGSKIFEENVSFSSIKPWTKTIKLYEGNYSLEVQEIEGSNKFIYDTTIHKQNIVVSKQNHVLSSNKNLYSITINNVYKPSEAKGSFGVYKTISGDEQIDSNDTFKFHVYGNGIDKFFDIKASKNSNIIETIEFKFSKAGNYQFTIEEIEVNSERPDWYQIAGKKIVNVTVEDNNGTLVVNVDSPKGDGLFEIVNNFKHKHEPIKAVFNVRKNSNSTKLDRFDVTIVNDSDPKQNQTIQISTKGDLVPVEVLLNAIGTHTINVQEKDCLNGYTCDAKNHMVEFDVVKDGYVYRISEIRVDGKITTNPVVEITNTYKWNPIETEIEFTKDFKDYAGGYLEHKFEFELTGEDFREVKTIINPIGVTKESFKLRFEKPGVYEYKLKEIKNSDETVSKWDEETRNIRVIVEDKDGVLVAKVDPVNLDFINVYKKPSRVNSVQFNFNLTKKIEGLDKDNKIFKFDISENGKKWNESILAMKNSNTSTKTINVAINTEGTHEYIISEQKLNYDNYIFDNSVYKVSIETLIVKEKIELESFKIYKQVGDDFKLIKSYSKEEIKKDNPEVVFINKFTPDPVEVSFKVEKKISITNEKPTEDKVFKFKLGKEEFEIKGEQEITFTFAQKFNEGEYDFDLTEVDLGYNDYTFSKDKYRIHVSVKRYNNSLKPEVTIYKNDKIYNKAIFVNTYSHNTPKPTTKPEVSKPETPKPSAPIVNTSLVR